MSGLSVRGVVVRYETERGSGPRSRDVTAAVDGVDLDVADGEILALLGPSGCGKSSLLRAIAGLEPLAAGSVAFDGADLAGVPVHRRGFGLLFQDGQLFAHRDVARNVVYGLEIAGVPRSERAARAAELLAAVGLSGYERRAVSTLSGGEKQRVALARALAPRPRLLLLDEPLSALDRALRERLADDVREVLRTTGTTAVFVTHDHDEAFAVADRVGVMQSGRLLQVAAPEALWRAPGSQAVAQFLGYQAFLPRDGGWLAVGPAGLRVVDTEPEQWPSAVQSRLGSQFKARVVASFFRRGRVQVSVDVDLGTGVQRLRAWHDGVPAPGTDVVVAIDPTGCAVVPA